MAKRLFSLSWALGLLFVLFSGTAFGQVDTIFKENMGTGSGNQTIAATTFQNSGTLTFSGTGVDTRVTTPSAGYTGSSGLRNVWYTNNTNSKTFTISGVNTTPFSSMNVSFGIHKGTNASNGLDFIVAVSVDGLIWDTLAFPPLPTGSGTVAWYLRTTTGSIPSTSNLSIRFSTSSNVGYRLDDVVLTGNSAAVPTISVAPTSHAFGTVANGSTNNTSYVVTASNLTAGVSVSSNNTQYTVSNNSGGPFASTTTLGTSGGTVYVRYVPTGGAASVTISNVSTTASANFTATGTGQAPCVAPANQATVLSLSPAATTINGSFTAASGGASAYLVLVSTSGTAPANPTTGTTYTNGAAYNGNTTVVDGASGTSFTASGLTPNTPYYFYVYAYNNTSCGGGPVYRTPALTNTATTLNAPIAIATYTFTGASGNEATFAADLPHPAGITPTVMSRAGNSGEVAANQFNGSGWATSASVDLGDYYQFSVSSAAGTNMNLVDLLVDMQRSSSGPQNYQVRTSIDGYSAIAGSGSIPTSSTTRTINLSGVAYQNLSGSVTFRIYGFNSGGGAGTFRIDNVYLNGFVNSGPTIITSVNSLNFSDQTVNTPSAQQSYTVEGFNLTGNITIAPPAGYQISTTSGSGFSTNNITLTPSGGTVNTTPIYVRFAPTAATAYNGNITHTSTGATQVDVALTGTGIPACVAPANQATNLVFNISNLTINGGFTAAVGGADGYLVLRSTNSTLSTGPVDGTTYALGATLGGGTVIGNTGSTTFNTTGTPNTQYYFFVYAFNNTNCGGGPIYKKPLLSGTATTLSAPYVAFDNFNRANSTTVGIPSSGGPTPWAEVEANTGLAEIYNNRLDINNNNPQGNAYVVHNMSNKYSTNFDQATSELVWYFNMAQTRPNPSGFASSNYGIATVLGATNSSFDNAGNGYAVVLGENGSNDRVKLVRFTGGLSTGTLTDIVADGPNTGGITGDHLFNVQVTYNPATGTWRLYVHDGGYDASATFNFADPTTIAYGAGSSAVDQTYTNTNLPYSGFFYSYATSSGEYASFDNLNIPTAQACQNTWTGALSTDWFTPGNWSCGFVPTATDDVVIPNTSAGSNNYPVIAAGNTATVRNLTISAGASVTVTANVVAGFPVSTNDLEVYGNFANNGVANLGTGTITFKGTTAQTISGNNNFQYLSINNTNGVSLTSGTQKVYGTLGLINGNLTTNNNLTIGSNATYSGLVDEFSAGHNGNIIGNLTVERYATNTATTFFYIGAPVGGAQISGWADDFSLATINGATDGSQVVPLPTCSPVNLAQGSPYGGLFDFREDKVVSCLQEGWHVRTTGAVVPGQGFIGRMPAGTVVDLTGTFVTGQTVTTPVLTRTPNTAGIIPGMNLVANPFAAPIDWKAVADGNTGSIMGTAYVYQTSGPLAGTNLPVNSVLGGSELGTSQSFLVEAVSNGVTMDFTDNMKRNGQNQYLRTAPVYDELLMMEVTGNGFADRAYVAFGSAFTTGFDSDFDARKLMSKYGQPSLYINDGNSVYSIFAQPSVAQVQIVPVDFVAGTNGNFSITTDLSTFHPTAMVYLEDRQTGTMANLRVDATYSFSATTADAAGRFALHFYPSMAIVANNATCAGADGEIALNQAGATEWDVELTNGNGDVVFTQANFNGSQTVGNLAPGTYTLNLLHTSGYTVNQAYLVEGPAPVSASFSAPILATEGDVVTFTNQATNATAYTWAFGDGSTSTDANPVHTYSYAGEYEVELVASNGICQERFTQTILVQEKVASGVTEAMGGKVKIYAYGTDIFVVMSNLEQSSTVTVYDLTGRKVISETKTELTNGTFVIDMQNVVNGYYFVRMSNEKDVFVQKVFVSSGK